MAITSSNAHSQLKLKSWVLGQLYSICLFNLLQFLKQLEVFGH